MGWETELPHRCDPPADVHPDRKGHVWRCDECDGRWLMRGFAWVGMSEHPEWSFVGYDT